VARHRRRQKKSPPAKLRRLQISDLGRRGEGIAEFEGQRIFVPYTLPGEEVDADVIGERGALRNLRKAADNRVAAPCPHFGTCGGCALQHLADNDYRRWKRALVQKALDQRGLDIEVDDLRDAHGEGRRRVTLHARKHGRKADVGFMRVRENRLHEIDHCLILSPDLDTVISKTADIAVAAAEDGATVDVQWTATETGLDCHIQGGAKFDYERQVTLADLAEAFDVARITMDGEIIVERRPPLLHMDDVSVSPAPGGFLQATTAGEQVLSDLVTAHAGHVSTAADLFCGVGPFALRLAAKATVFAADGDAVAIGALDRAVRFAQNLKPIERVVRDLAHDPLLPSELASFDAVVFDPPRAGAMAQADSLASSAVPLVVGVSCDPGTFARDAATLVDGGFVLERVTPVDQFKYAAHVEMVGLFRRR